MMPQCKIPKNTIIPPSKVGKNTIFNSHRAKVKGKLMPQSKIQKNAITPPSKVGGNTKRKFGHGVKFRKIQEFPIVKRQENNTETQNSPRMQGLP